MKELKFFGVMYVSAKSIKRLRSGHALSPRWCMAPGSGHLSAARRKQTTVLRHFRDHLAPSWVFFFLCSVQQFEYSCFSAPPPPPPTSSCLLNLGSSVTSSNLARHAGQGPMGVTFYAAVCAAQSIDVASRPIAKYT